MEDPRKAVVLSELPTTVTAWKLLLRNRHLHGSPFRVIFFVALFVVPAHAFQAGHLAGSDLKHDYDAAQQAQSEGNLPRAATYSKLFVVHALHLLATNFANVGDFPKATALFDEGLLLEPDDVEMRLDYVQESVSAGDLVKAKQLAQELVVRDKVDMLMGATFTPNALAMAAIADQAGIPFLITNAGTGMITEKSNNVARFSFTMWQSAIPLGTWAAKNFKTAYTLVSDYAPGFDIEAGFIKSYKEGGGAVVGSVRVPVTNQDFSAYMQRVKDAHPNALMVFVPGGKSASAVMKAFSDLGLKDAGIKLIGPGDIVPDEELPNMGDEALGVMTVHHYSAAADRPANQAFLAAWHQEYGDTSIPNFVAADTYDAMAAVVAVVKAQGGKLDTARTMALLKEFKDPGSPRGPIAIDPATRDIVQNEYLRETRRVNGKLQNIEIETVATAEKDPWKAQQTK